VSEPIYSNTDKTLIAKHIYTSEVLPLNLTDTCEQALAMMNVYHINNLPVVRDTDLLGVITEEELTTVHPDTKIGEINLSMSHLYVREEEHVFEIISKITQNNLSTIPVLNNKEKYVGLITMDGVTKYYASTFSFNEPGSIIVLKIHRKEYSLSEVTRVIEMEGGIILASFITSILDNQHVFLTIKITRHEMNKILSSLERYDYTIHATFSEEDYRSDLQLRYDSLMTYLNI